MECAIVFGAWIFDQTRALAGKMTNTPGHALFIKNTGHCIHNERPRMLANAILNLILDEPASPLDHE